jgi:hypothetical protein
MSENTSNAALRRMGFKNEDMTSHGFRRSASSMLNESGLWNADVIERQLASVLLLGLRVSCVFEVCGAFGWRVLARTPLRGPRAD